MLKILGVLICLLGTQVQAMLLEEERQKTGINNFKKKMREIGSAQLGGQDDDSSDDDVSDYDLEYKPQKGRQNKQKENPLRQSNRTKKSTFNTVNPEEERNKHFKALVLRVKKNLHYYGSILLKSFDEGAYGQLLKRPADDSLLKNVTYQVLIKESSASRSFINTLSKNLENKDEISLCKGFYRCLTNSKGKNRSRTSDTNKLEERFIKIVIELKKKLLKTLKEKETSITTED